jgi:hypothetical protein
MLVVYPIVKVTAKHIFVGRDSHLVGEEDDLACPRDPIAESASLDRVEFESEGRIYYHKWREVFRQTLPGPSRSAPNAMIEQSLSVLGLTTWPATPGEIRAAYKGGNRWWPTRTRAVRTRSSGMSTRLKKCVR